MPCVKTWLLKDSRGRYYYIEQQPYQVAAAGQRPHQLAPEVVSL